MSKEEMSKEDTSGWNPVRRALGEFVIIVLGVLVALAVDQWRNSLDDRGRETAYLHALEESLLFDSTELSKNIESHARGLTNARYVLPFLEDPDRPLGDTAVFLGAAFRASRWDVPFLQTDTYEDLISTGNLHLIRSAALRAEILSYYRETQWILFDDWPLEYQNAARGAMPAEVLGALWDRCPVKLDGPGCREPVDLGSLDQRTAVRRVRSAAGIDLHLRLLIDRFGVASRRMEGKRGETEALLASVRDAMR
jgi:hypothetical protein